MDDQHCRWRRRRGAAQHRTAKALDARRCTTLRRRLPAAWYFSFIKRAPALPLYHGQANLPSTVQRQRWMHAAVLLSGVASQRHGIFPLLLSGLGDAAYNNANSYQLPANSIIDDLPVCTLGCRVWYCSQSRDIA